MRFVRAAENHQVGAMRRCLAAYPALARLVPDPMSPALRARDGLRPFRQHAVELAREAAVADLQALHSDLPESAGVAFTLGFKNYALVARELFMRCRRRMAQ